MKRVVASLVIGSALLLTAACGGSSSPSSSTSTTAPTDGSSASESTSAASPSESASESTAPSVDASSTEAAGPALPDACGLLTSDDIASITGTAPGNATPDASDPSMRTICMFDSGLILAIEVGADWAETIDYVKNNSSDAKLTEVTDIGDEALLSVYEGETDASQLLVLDGDYFYAAVGAITPDQAKQLVAKMIDAVDALG